MTEPSPFGKPGFLVAAVAVAGVAILALVLVFTNAGGRPEPRSPAPSGSPESSPESAADDDASICGLEGEVLDGRLTGAPDVDAWEYQLTTPYPVSSEYGPGATNDAGVRHCFQHSPEGALFAASGALAQATDPSLRSAWVEEFLTPGALKDEWTSRVPEEAAPDVRLIPAGFRLLSYDGATARVDLAVRSSAGGQDVLGSYVYALIWQDGDWRLDAEDPRASSYATIPDLAGYVTWGA